MSSPFMFILLITGAVLAIIGGVMCLIAAFRQSLMWGLAYLLIPGGKLFFYCFHWQESKRGFSISMVGLLLAFGSIVVMPDGTDQLAKMLHLPPSAESRKRIADEAAAKLQEGRDHVDKLHNEYTQVSNEVAHQYQALTASRNALNTKDATAVHQFNIQNTAYQQQNARLKQITAEIATAEKTVSDLLDERAKHMSEMKHVVIYTSDHCPACRVAKTYLAEKGVNYQEINLDVTDEEHLKEFKSMGGNVIPLIIVGDKKMEGFNQRELDAML